MSSQLADESGTGLITREHRPQLAVMHGRDLEAERALTERARSDRSAFAQLYRSHVDAVYGFAFRMCGSKEVAEEATSATFERALRSIQTFEWRGGGVRPWLFRIASNEVTEIYRRNARASGSRGQRALRSLAPGMVGDDDGWSDTDNVEDTALLHQALSTLNPRYREAITLRYLGDMSPDDAAAALGCSKATLAVTLYRALGALRKAMDAAAARAATNVSTEGRQR